MDTSTFGADRDDVPAADDADGATPGPAESLAIIDAQRALVRDRAEPDGRLLFGLWGVAWVIGYSALFWTAKDAVGQRPAAWAFTVFAACLGIAVVVTIVHVLLRTRGVRGISARSGMMYGWSWTIGFVGIVAINNGLMRAGAGTEVLDLAWNALPCLFVGVMYLAGGALWQEWTVFVLGVWIILVAGAATVVGLPTTYLVMATAGGGGMLVGALVTHLVRARTARAARER